MIRTEAVERAFYLAAAAQRLHEVKTDPAARAAWLASFPMPWRDDMAVYADQKYGVLPEVTT